MQGFKFVYLYICIYTHQLGVHVYTDKCVYIYIYIHIYERTCIQYVYTNYEEMEKGATPTHLCACDALLL